MNCNKLSADVWNLCILLDNQYKEETGKSIGLSEIQKRTKKCVNLHSKGIHHVAHKYLHARDAMWKSRKAKHENSSKVELPYKQKKYFVTGWDYQSIVIDKKKHLIKLSKPDTFTNGKRNLRIPVKCKAKFIPDNIVEIELIYKNKLYLAIKYKELNMYKQIESNNKASIDLGEIHSITSIDNNGNAIIITGRKIRETKQLRNKELAKLKSRRSKCTKGSKQYKKYSKAINNLKIKTDIKY